MGPVKGIKKARQVVIDCMKNIHPVYNIKRLMIQRELAKDPKLKNEDWSRFLPEFSKKNVARRTPLQSRLEKEKAKKGAAAAESGAGAKDTDQANVAAPAAETGKKKKVYTPFPPAQTPSKIDMQLESGEYFLSERERKSKKLMEKTVKSAAKSKEKRAAREAEFEPPTAKSSASKNKNAGGAEKESKQLDIESLKSKLSSAGKRKRGGEGTMSDFVDVGKKRK